MEFIILEIAEQSKNQDLPRKAKLQFYHDEKLVFFALLYARNIKDDQKKGDIDISASIEVIDENSIPLNVGLVCKEKDSKKLEEWEKGTFLHCIFESTPTEVFKALISRLQPHV